MTELDQDTLDEIIRRVVEVAHPEQIILFGSAAQGTMTRNSDVDLLIVKEGGDTKNLRARIYENLYGVRVAVDISFSPFAARGICRRQYSREVHLSCDGAPCRRRE